MLGKKKYNQNVKKMQKIRGFDFILQISAAQTELVVCKVFLKRKEKKERKKKI